MTRPEATAGPMLRNCRPLKVSAVMPPFFSSSAGLAASCAGFSFFLAALATGGSCFLFSLPEAGDVWEKTGSEMLSNRAMTKVRRRNEIKVELPLSKMVLRKCWRRTRFDEKKRNR